VGGLSGPRETVRNLIAPSREGALAYRHRDPPKVDWGAYDRAQVHDMDDPLQPIHIRVDEATRQVHARTPWRKGRRGPSPTSAADLAKVLLAQEYFPVPNRVAERLLEIFRVKLSRSERFGCETIERGGVRTPVFVEISEELSVRPGDGPPQPGGGSVRGSSGRYSSTMNEPT